MLSTQAFNAFLKTLEEPPTYAKFILATTEKHKIIPTILSRCQIYDFKRITVEDIADHLAYVADQEGVTAELDALHVIAQKSDGALRDALSIFDQIISFSGKVITYKHVIENLNVLDYDYFFRMTRLLLDQDLSSTLLLINEIIDNGFDGQHFLIGFGEHLRNLLVCKDPETVTLLEVGGSIREKYAQQSAESPVSFLLKALEINNKCDLNYKSSNNKKLLLELALMQMCTLVGDPLQPRRPIVSGKEQGIKKQEVKKSPDKLAEKPSRKVEPTMKQPDPVKRTTPSTISIRSQTQPKEKKGKQEEDLSNKPADDFTEEQLLKAWVAAAEKFRTDKNIYFTLKRSKPVRKGKSILEFTVDNKIQKKEIEDRKMDLLPPIKESLNNFHIDLTIKVNEQAAESKAYLPQEKFKKMAQKNPALKTMKDRLNLEIDF
jgi:DNA polymerase-3 subunit gamma/tau